MTVGAVPFRCSLETKFGELVIELNPRNARRAVNNFMHMVKAGFYDDLVFHRVIPGFIAQAGCPEGDGSGHAGFSFTGEVPVGYRYRRGDVALASSGPKDGNGSQFFICLADLPDLEPVYPLIGSVVEGDSLIDRFNTVDADDLGHVKEAITINAMKVSL